ncbi:MAG: FixH family protein [Flavobacteriaceae bacterium]|nr:FixH family protein [Flavobacteriaceae bacterium]
MKINWGKGIVIAIISFVSFIMYFVISMSTNEKFRHDLVTEKYYEKELNYQQVINATKNAKSLKEDIKIIKDTKGLQIQLPKIFEKGKVEGKVFLYRPSNKQLDFEIPISITDNYLLVPEKRLLGGRWNISVNLKYNNKDYYFSKKINY